MLPSGEAVKTGSVNKLAGSSSAHVVLLTIIPDARAKKTRDLMFIKSDGAEYDFHKVSGSILEAAIKIIVLFRLILRQARHEVKGKRVEIR